MQRSALSEDRNTAPSPIVKRSAPVLSNVIDSMSLGAADRSAAPARPAPDPDVAIGLAAGEPASKAGTPARVIDGAVGSGHQLTRPFLSKVIIVFAPSKRLSVGICCTDDRGDVRLSSRAERRAGDGAVLLKGKKTFPA